MLTAAVTHASWHALVKTAGNRLEILAGMGVVAGGIAVCALPFVQAPPPRIWPILALSVLLHSSYKLCLAAAYARADLGQAFPLARGMVPPFATLLALVFLFQAPSLPQLLGIVLIACGLLLLAQERSAGRINAPLLLVTATAGLLVAGYSVLDAYGMRQMGDWLGFTAWLVAIDSVAFLLYCRWSAGAAFWTGLAAARSRVAASGLLGVASFGVFMWAISFNPIGPVVALRETNVLFAVLIGVVLYGEPLSTSRIAAACAILAGIATIAAT